MQINQNKFHEMIPDSWGLVLKECFAQIKVSDFILYFPNLLNSMRYSFICAAVIANLFLFFFN